MTCRNVVEPLTHLDTVAAPARMQLRGSGGLDAPWLLDFLATRALPGLEQVRAGAFGRWLSLPGSGAPIAIALQPAGPRSLTLRVDADDPALVRRVRDRIRALLALTHDLREVEAVLAADPTLALAAGVGRGSRVPGGFEPFEQSVRAVLGQQVSVAGARTLAGRLIERYGAPLAGRADRPHGFPGPARLADLEPTAFGIPRARGAAIVALARLCRDEPGLFEQSPRSVRARLLALRGIGPWTVEYIAMRVLRDPDAFPVSDLVLQHAWKALGRRTGDPRTLEQASAAWHPWRATAVIWLWRWWSAHGDAERRR